MGDTSSHDCGGARGRSGAVRRSRFAALGDERLVSFLAALRKCSLTEVSSGGSCGSTAPAALTDAVGGVVDSAKRVVFQQTKAYKHRAQIEAIARHCLLRLPKSCDLVVELGAGQGVLGHAVAASVGLPLVTVERRSNTTAFGSHEAAGADEPSADESQGRTGLSAPVVRRVVADIADGPICPADATSVCLLAKHLCGHGSDLAIDAALELGPRLSLLCLAPCCHATMRWEQLSEEERQLLRRYGVGLFGGGCNHDNGFGVSDADARGQADPPSLDDGLDDFCLLSDVIKLSRAGVSRQPPGGARYVPCAKWRLRRFVADSEIEELGRCACRLVDEMRLARLRAAGFSVALVRYCSEDLTPDNVLILAAPLSVSAHTLAVCDAQGPLMRDTLASERAEIVLLELDPTAPETLPQRLTSYLLEQWTRLFPAIDSVCPAPAEFGSSCGCPALMCRTTADRGGLVALLECLRCCPLVQRVVCRLLPLEAWSEGGPEAIALAAKQLLVAKDAPNALLRVSARPRSVEAAVCAVLPAELLSPVHFTHVLHMACLEPAHPNGELPAGARLAVLRRELCDPKAWTETVKAANRVPRAAACFSEVAHRWPARFAGLSSVALWSDSTETWLPEWAARVLGPGAASYDLKVRRLREGRHAALATVTAAAAEPQECGNAATVHVEFLPEGGLPADLLLCGSGCVGGGGGSAETLDVLAAVLRRCFSCEAPRLARKGVAVLRLRCGRSGRAVKRWHRETATQLETKLGARRVELLHLLTDKELERTAIFSWDADQLLRTPSVTTARVC